MALKDLIDRIQDWDSKRKLTALTLMVVALSGIILLITWAQAPDYQILYTNLQPDDAGAIIQKLKEMKVPYKSTQTGILVPSDQVYELRLQLASMGLPQGGGIGYEIFDRTGLGTTEFVQKVNLRRALQGELSRTIRSLQEVMDCRVHLTIPERSIFTSLDQQPKASVLLKLRPGVKLTKRQVQGIVHLVASSVEGLSPDNVTVIDNKGNILNTKTDDTTALTTTQLEYQRAIEHDIEKRIISILTPVVGKNRVRAKASVNIDFTKVEETQEIYDPDGQVVRSKQKLTERKSLASTAGVPGVQSNLPGRTTRTGKSKAGITKETETVNYEISKILSHVVKPTGVIKRISVAVLVDGKYKEDGSGKKQYIPRTEEEIKTYEELVKKAIGFSDERSDEVKIVSMPFEVQEEVFQAEPEKDYMRYIIPTVKYGTILLLALLILLFIVRPLMKALKTPPPAPVRQPSYPSTAEIEAGPERRELPSRDEIIEWAKENPQKAAMLIKKWMGGNP